MVVECGEGHVDGVDIEMVFRVPPVSLDNIPDVLLRRC